MGFVALLFHILAEMGIVLNLNGFFLSVRDLSVPRGTPFNEASLQSILRGIGDSSPWKQPGPLAESVCGSGDSAVLFPVGLPDFSSNAYPADRPVPDLGTSRKIREDHIQNVKEEDGHTCNRNDC